MEARSNMPSPRKPESSQSSQHAAKSPARRYEQRGVFAFKQAVHAAIENTDPGLYPSAFCKIVPDYLTGNSKFCVAMHADGVGTKSALAYLWYKETGDPSVFRGIAQDALVMNVDDLLCVGALGPFLVSNTIGRNAFKIPDEIIGEIIAGFEDQVKQFAKWDIELVMTGGETADVGDLVRTIIVDSTVTARMPRAEVVANNNVNPGDVIIGLASDGKSTYEAEYNSGIGSNGLTSARHDLLNADYWKRYPETAAPEMRPERRYTGQYRLEDQLEGTSLTIGQALLSPTRTFAPIIKLLLESHRDKISALIHCTGSGRFKSIRAGHETGINYDYDNFTQPAPPVFHKIWEQGNTKIDEMFEVFNMGYRMEIIGDAELERIVKDIAARFGIHAQQIGHCTKSKIAPSNQITLHVNDEIYPDILSPK